MPGACAHLRCLLECTGSVVPEGTVVTMRLLQCAGSAV